MKRGIALILLSAILITAFCACSSRSSVDPICDISLFDDNSAKIERLLGAPEEREQDGRGCVTLRYSDFRYLGRSVDLVLNLYEDDPMNNEAVLSYYYRKDYSPSNEDEVYSPTAAELKAAQAFKEEIIALLTKRYGDPVWKSDNGLELVWLKEQRMDHAEAIKLEEGYSEIAFDLYWWIG